MDLQSQESSRFKPVSGLGILATLAPFPATIVKDLGPILGPTAGYLAFGAFGGLIILMVLGITRGFPSWSLPTFGLFVTFLALPALAFWWPVFIFLPPLADWMRLVIGSGWPWFSLCLIGVSAIVVMPLIPRVPLYERIRRDWIWLAFALYGSAALWLWLTFDEYTGKLPYVVAACTTLVFGALVYLRASRPWMRFGVLLGSLLLAILMVAWAKWNLVPTQTWPLDINDELRWSETRDSLVGGAWLVLAVLGPPALVRLLPRQRGRSPTTPI